MRRRIDPHDLSDETGRPYSWHYQAPPVLYDDELWERLQTAREKVLEIEREVCAALVEEPLDEVEEGLIKEVNELQDQALAPDRKITSAEYVAKTDEIKARALAHAATRTKP